MTEDGTRHRLLSGGADKPVPYWRAIRVLADHLYGRPARPGVGYALTEVVRCKSPHQIGVPRAVKTCAPLYLERTLICSPALVICVVGRVARREMRRLLAYPDAPEVSEPLDVAGRNRPLVFVSGLNGRAGRTPYPKTVPEDQLAPVREALAAAWA